MEHSLEQITCQATKQISNLIRIKSYPTSFQTTCYETRNQSQEEKNLKKYKHMEAKQHATKQPMGQQVNSEIK